MSDPERISSLQQELDSRFGDRGEAKFFRAPGRVDIMGSHTDYNEGFILASTVDKDVIAAARKTSTGVASLYSQNQKVGVRINLDQIKCDPEHGWANYAKGVIKELIELRVQMTGLDMVVHGNVPIGASLSSSAALEAATCEAVLGVFETGLPPWEKVHLARRAENVFVGMPCGIMDQFAVIMGDGEHALLLDCRSLEFQKVPFKLEGAELLVIDSGQGRELVSGNYAQRVEECKEAVKILKAENEDVRSLRDAGMEELENVKTKLGDPLYGRARHVVSENARVKDAARAMRSGDYEKLGEIMEAGYLSSRDDYENSTPELDALHGMVSGMDGIYGVRICGAGWGGCLLALADKDMEKAISDEVSEGYRKKTGLTLQVWTVRPSEAAGPL